MTGAVDIDPPAADADCEARLLRVGMPLRGNVRGSPKQAREIARGRLVDLVEIVRNDDGDELWRYTIVLDGDRYIRNAELRVMVREAG